MISETLFPLEARGILDLSCCNQDLGLCAMEQNPECMTGEGKPAVDIF